MRTLENHFSTIVIFDRDDLSMMISEMFLQRAGYEGTIVKLNSVDTVHESLAEVKHPVLFITDYFTNYLDDFEFFEEYRKSSDKVIVVGEFEKELERFTKQYKDVSFFRKPHTVEEVQSWLRVN